MDFAIIAAGEGSRLVEEGVSLPKPLVKIGGEPMIDRLVKLFMAQDAETVHIIVNREMVEVQEQIKALAKHYPIRLVVKSTPSSMHSFHELSEGITCDKFCLTTVDTIFREEDFAAYVKAFAATSGIDGLMGVTSYIDDEKPLYVEVDADNRIVNFRDVDYDGSKYISGGIYGLTQAAIPVLKQCIAEGVSRMRNFQRRLVTEGLNLKAYPFTKIIDVDHASDIEKAQRFLR